MEIIMKVKCSPSPGPGTSPHSSLKIVDHHHQLNQHTYATTNASAVYKSNTPPQNVIPTRTYTPNNTHHHPGGKYTIAPPTATSPTSASCNDCSLGYCCNMPQCCVTTPSPQYSQTPPQIQPASSSPFSANEQYSSNSCQSSIVTDEPEFVSIDDEKVKQYLIRVGREKLQKQQQEREQQRHRPPQPQLLPQLQHPVKEPRITHVFSATSAESTAKPVVYEIIELDDEDEREKLKQIKQQAEQRIANKKLLSTNPHISFATRNTKSLDISLIPKSNENRTQNSSLETSIKTTAARTTKNNPSNHKIIAEIDLLESDDDDDRNDDVDNENSDKYKDDDNDEYMKDDNDDEDDDDDDETLPLAAVSCELECDDDDDEINDVHNPPSRNPVYNRNYSQQQQQRQHQPIMRYSKPLVNDVVIVGSDEDKHHDDNLLVRWEEYEGQRERVFFECFLCGKKVQSSYNLRRHMMIHTGERPFGCDLCDRRFREFSDLKKHRRRHSNEPNYLCMVCHKQKPVEIDPTRCRNCCTQSKNAVIMAAMKPATEADMAAESKARIKAATEAKIAQTSSAALKAKINQQTTQTTQLPTIASVTSYNVAAKTSQTSSITTASKRPVNGDGSGSSGTTSPKATEQTQRLLDNIPAVHRPGYNNLGMITRKEFPCPLCNRAFGTRHNLKRHYMIHTGEKPFSCNKCRKPFREFSTLKKHMVTHMRERWYKCSHCTVKFRDFLKYTEHKETHANDIECEERLAASRGVSYGKLDVDSYMIDSNDEESGPEDWLECCECGQRFNEIDAYNEHLKEHDVNNKIFECYICKENMKSRSELDKHLRLQHKYEIENDMMDNDDDDDDDGEYGNDNEEGEEEAEIITA